MTDLEYLTKLKFNKMLYNSVNAGNIIIQLPPKPKSNQKPNHQSEYGC